MSKFQRLRQTSGTLVETLQQWRWVGFSQGLRTILYRPRLAWYERRFPAESEGPTHQHTLASSMKTFMTRKKISSSRSPSPAGSVEHVDDIENGIALKLTDGICTIMALNPYLVRVRFLRAPEMPPYFSYATVLPGETVAVARGQDEGVITFSTSEIQCHIRVHPFGLSIMDARGSLLMGDIENIIWEEQGVTLEGQLVDDATFYGLGEHAQYFSCRGKTFQLTTNDPACYHPHDDPLYVNIPFIAGVQTGMCFGVFLDSSYEATIDIGHSQGDKLVYYTHGPECRFDFMIGPSLPEVVERFTELTGRMNLPPQWALGYHQSRWSYESAEIIAGLAKEFRRRQLPCDAIHFDIDYMDGFRCFTWNQAMFPDPVGLIADLHHQGFKAVAMIDPGIKVDPDYAVCADGVAHDMFCELPDGSLFHGPVWPGECYFPDFTSPRVREWWGEWYQALLEDGFDGFWNDMNEPAIFGGQVFPHAVQHDFEGHGGDHRQARSIYGMQMVRATYEGLNRFKPDHRNWVFSRSGYAGVQRYASSWTGDNYSEWPDLRLTPAMLLNLGLSGLSFTGADVGGFEGTPTPELFARWFSMAAFTPFFRTHCAKHSPPQEPWSYGQEVEDIARKYLEWRYRLLPAIYTAFWQCSQRGTPIMRPLLYEDAQDPVYRDLYDQWFLGDHLLVSPVLDAGATHRKLQLPPGRWFDFWDHTILEGPAHLHCLAPLDIVPIHVRAGTVLPLAPVRQHVDELPSAPLELHLYAGDGVSYLYEDDGISLAYQRGSYRLTRWSLGQHDETLVLTRGMEGDYMPPYDQFTLIVHGVSIQAVALDDEPVTRHEEGWHVPRDGWTQLTITVS